MDLQQEWNRLNERHFSPGEPVRLAVSDLMRHPAESPLAKLRRNARINMGYAVAFILLFIALFVWNSHPYVRICLGILIAAYLVAALFTGYKLHRLPPVPDMNGPLLPVMKAYHTQLRAWINWQERVALFIYPISIAGGFFLSLAARTDLDAALREPKTLGFLIAAVLVLTPAGFWLARRMNNLAFGTYLNQLKTNIDLLEKPE
ncbi:MAG: hypothetical protein R3D58_14665 [Saprospiraceae bacterium]